MADLNPEALRRFIDAIVPRIVELTGLSREQAKVAAVSLIPPFEEDGAGNILLRDEEGRLVGSVSAAEIDPCEVLEGIED